MKKLTFIILLLIAGLYIDILWGENVDVCVGPYRQKVVHIMSIVPFIPERKHLLLGIGHKHFEYNIIVSDYSWDDEPLQTSINAYGCGVEYYKYQQRNFLGSNTALIQINPFAQYKFDNITIDDQRNGK